MLVVRLAFLWHRYKMSSLTELRHGPGTPLAFNPPVPKSMRVVNVVSFPLAHHLSSPLARRAFNRLAPLGPNDAGGIMLGDLHNFPGVIYPVWGADHYLTPDRIDDLIRRILQLSLEEVATEL